MNKKEYKAKKIEELSRLSCDGDFTQNYKQFLVYDDVEAFLSQTIDELYGAAIDAIGKDEYIDQGTPDSCERQDRNILRDVQRKDFNKQIKNLCK